MKYLQPKFSVYANYIKEPKCSRCLNDLKVGYCTAEGMLCYACYQEIQREKKIRKIISEY